MNHALTDGQVANRLLTAVSIKTLLEIVFVCAVVSTAAVESFHPFLRGALDIVDASVVAGWAYDPTAKDEPLQVQLFIDGAFVAADRAIEVRKDLVEAGAAAEPEHGFSFSLKSTNLAPGGHTAMVYAVRTSIGGNLSLIPISKEPVRFEVR